MRMGLGKLSSRKLEALDRRAAAVHEAGHVVIGREVGIKALSARIFRIGDGDISNNKTWGGQTRYSAPERLSQHKWAMFAVAGTVGELCWRREEDWDWEDPAALSPTDWAGCGCEPGAPSRAMLKAIDMTVALLTPDEGRLWPQLIKEARWLMPGCRS
jgi:hypothetical protein